MDKSLPQAAILLLLFSLITDLSAEFSLAQSPLATGSEESADSAKTDSAKTDSANTDSGKTDSGKTESTSAKRYSTREFHDPNGIGKFYMGREIAHVMGFSGAEWLERDSREKEERLTLLVKSLKIKPNMTIADIGAGSGVITFLIAEQLGDKGRVLGVDVQDEMLNRLKERAQERGITNVVPVKGTQKSPNLKPGTVDVAIMVDVYHEFEFPYEMLNEIARALKPGGRVAFVEYRKEDPTVPIKLVHKMTEAQVRKEAGQPEFGLRFKETIGVLPRQHIVVFERIQPKKSGVEK